jgi:hypothetical protein
MKTAESPWLSSRASKIASKRHAVAASTNAVESQWASATSLAQFHRARRPPWREVLTDFWFRHSRLRACNY